MVTIKSKREIEYIRESCKIVAMAQEAIKEAIKPGISTYELNEIAEKVIYKHNAIPSCKNFPSGIKGIPPFPAGVCISVNDEVIHGIPSSKKIINHTINAIIAKNCEIKLANIAPTAKINPQIKKAFL